MEREEKGEEGAAEKQDFLGIKLRRGILVGKRGGPCTPVPTWKLEDVQDNTIKASLTIPSTVSARTLGANLWELQHLQVPKMSRGGVRLRHKDRVLELPTYSADPSHSPPDQVEKTTEPRSLALMIIFWDLSRENIFFCLFIFDLKPFFGVFG